MWLNYGFFMSDNPAETYCLKFALNTDDLDYDAKLYLLEGFDDDDEKAEPLEFEVKAEINGELFRLLAYLRFVVFDGNFEYLQQLKEEAMSK